MSTRTDPVDLVFDLATELALLVDAAHLLVPAAGFAVDPGALQLLDKRKREAREALVRFKAWCDEGPES